MIAYRAARNTDPPALVQLWNECLAGRGAYPLRTPQTLERWVFSKPYYKNADLILATDGTTDEGGGKLVGLALSGFTPGDDGATLDRSRGVICIVVVHPAFRRRGIGRELLRRAEANLRERGAETVAVGATWPDAPYLFGLYGGSSAPGLLESDADYAPFLAEMGYAPAEPVLVFQRPLEEQLSVADGRFGMLRRRYELQTLRAAGIANWWQECQWGVTEPVELQLTDKLTSMPAARAVVWELEGFSWRWGRPTAGLMEVQVRPDLRRLGIGKLLAWHALRLLQDQYFAAVECQVPADDEAAAGLCRSLGMEQIDRGLRYVPVIAHAPADPKPGADTDDYPLLAGDDE
jgi:ribosomal protein S18 acetylase RimI-like enzyme